MDKIIHGKYVNQGEDLTEILKVRREIFDCGEDEKDPEAINVLISLVENAQDEGVIIGCGRLTFDVDNFRFIIDRLGIKKEYRRSGYGEFALRTLVDKVNQCGADRAYVNKNDIVSDEAENFFRKMFFKPDETEADFLSAMIDSFHTCCH